VEPAQPCPPNLSEAQKPEFFRALEKKLERKGILGFRAGREGGYNGMSKLGQYLASRVRDVVGSRPRIGEGILAPKVHLHCECVGRALENPRGVNGVELMTPSGLRRWRRLLSLRRRPRWNVCCGPTHSEKRGKGGQLNVLGNYMSLATTCPW
jgi:hypothetical protein